jgi:hypothetical protein
MARPPILGILCLFLAAQLHAADSWQAAFVSPPPETKPWVYWYWVSDNISKEGITRDLEAMGKQGIAEAEIGNVDVVPESRGKVKALSPEYWEMIEHAVREGKRLGVRVGLFNSPGWSQSGGPWVKPAQSMRYLVASETHVKGPTKFRGSLAEPVPNFQQVAVLAFPVPKSDDEILKPQVSREEAGPAFDGDPKTSFMLPTTAPGGAQPFEVDLEVAQPFTARSISLYPAKSPGRVQVEVQAIEPDGGFRTIRSFEVDRRNPGPNIGPMHYGPVVISLPETKATHFRLVFRNIEGAPGFEEIAISAAPRLERYVEKQLGKMFQEPLPLWGQYVWPTQAEADDKSLYVDPAKIVNLSAEVGADGEMSWDVPEGEWIISRIGMTPTGVTNGPASPEATGLEIDKMSRPAVRAHFDAYVGKLLSRIPDVDRSKMGHVVADSYEMGSQNWTDGLGEVFEQRYGYDPIPWLIVLSGRIVGSADQSERFLWDLRRLVADRISTEYVGGLREIVNEHQLNLWLENYGHWGFPGEFLSYGGNSDRVSGEFWTSGDLGSIELHAAASAAHTYDKKFVSAEAFTSGGPSWQLDPWALKKRGDWSLTEGVNHFVLHVYIHQPYEQTPGMNAPFGTEFNRNNTWFPLIHGWIDSFRRTHALLQNGKPVADVLYFIGEDAPKMTGIRDPQLPDGYAFDYINAEILERDLNIKDGKFVLPNGLTYSLLVLPPSESIRPQVLEKIRELVEAGGAMMGPAPTRSPSMQDFPKADQQVRDLASALWNGIDGKTATHSQVGNGHVFQGVGVAEAMEVLKVQPDIAGQGKLLWTHRADESGEAYFVSNQEDTAVEVSPSFRVTGRQPEWWDNVSGVMRDLPEFTQEKNRTIVPLKLAPRGSGFVIFRKPTDKPLGAGENFPEPKVVQTLDGPWKVRFGKNDERTFEPLSDWSVNEDPTIRFFSGPAVYSKTFTIDEVPRNPLLDLGKVEGVASVKLNGKDLGVLWANPRQADVNGLLRKGENTLEVEVVNGWRNRILGDFKLPEKERTTWTAVQTLRPEDSLQPSGLIGPVEIKTAP